MKEIVKTRVRIFALFLQVRIGAIGGLFIALR